MSKGDMKTACRMLEQDNRTWETSPATILRRTRYHGGWKEFTRWFPGTIEQTDANRYRISMPCDDMTSPLGHEQAESSRTILEPGRWAESAAAFIIGEESQPGITPYEGARGTQAEPIAHFATLVDETILSNLPPIAVDQPFELYTIDNRSLLYTTSDSGFTLYGASVLSQMDTA